jgi:hypothetical protein
MALTVTRPNYWTITLDSNQTSQYKFKYVVHVQIGVAVQIILKQSVNLNGSAHFNIEKIVKNYFNITHKHANTITGSVDYDSIHLMPQNTTDVGIPPVAVYDDYPMSKNNKDIITFTFECYEEYSTTADGSPELQFPATVVTYPFINYANEWEDLMNFEKDLFAFHPTYRGRFLTLLPYDTNRNNATANKIPHLTSYNDYKTFAFLNNNSLFGTTNGEIVYSFFDEVPIFEEINGNFYPTNYVAKIRVNNSSTRGGVTPSTTSQDDEYLIYVGVGGANVKNIKYGQRGGYQLLDTSSVKYYTVYYGYSNEDSKSYTQGVDIKQGDRITIVADGGTGAGEIDYTSIGAASNTAGTSFYATGSTTGTGSYNKKFSRMSSKIYMFEIASENNCNATRFDEYTLAWKNKYGVWDYYMFDGEHTDVRNYTREDDYERIAGDYAGASFTINSYERGKVQKIEGVKQTTINTRYITDEYNDYFNGLLMSNEVVLLSPVKKGDDDVKQVPIPVNIVDTSITYKTNSKDKLVQYSFTFEYAHKLKKVY